MADNVQLAIGDLCEYCDWCIELFADFLDFVLWVCEVACAIFVFLFRFLFGFDLPAREGVRTDGTGIFTFLAGLLTTQAAGLVILAQGKSSEFVSSYLLVYIVFASLPLFGIVRSLRLRCSNDQGLQRGFDPQTISFGRWVLFFGLLLAVGLPILGAAGRIPGQDTRVEYTNEFVQFLPVQPDQATPKNISNEFAREFIHKHMDGFRPKPNQRLLFVEQDGHFTENYKPFNTMIAFGNQVVAVDGEAYLMHIADEPISSPTYRLQRLLPKEHSDIQRHVVEIIDANKNDVMLLFLVVEGRFDKKSVPPNIAAPYLFKLRTR